MSKIILRNVAECRRCGHWVWSKSVHDFRAHSCDDFVWFMVDGGHAYIRRGWGNEKTPHSRPEDHYIERSIEINPHIYDYCLRGLVPDLEPWNEWGIEYQKAYDSEGWNKP